MNKEELLATGLTEEQAEKVLAEMGSLQKSLKERDKQLSELQKAAVGNEDLQKQIADLQKQNAEQEKAHKAELAQVKLDNAIDGALTAVGAKNNKAARALLDLSKVQLGEDGKLQGWQEQLEALQKSDGYLFAQQTGTTFRGFQPGASGSVPNSKTAGYEARLADARKNNNQLEVIKIKQEAAGEGVVLM